MQTKQRDVYYCNVDLSRIMLSKPRLNKKNLIRLYEFITERYKIHIRKDLLHEKRPWTKNPILNEYKFTNVFREDDKVTRALIELISKSPGLTLEEKVLNSFLFRSWNNPDTFTDFGGPWSAKEIYSGLKLKEAVRPIYKRLFKAEPDRKWWSSAYNQGGTKYSWKFPDGEGFSRAPTEAEGKKFKDYEPDIPLRVFHIGPWLKELRIYDRLMAADNQLEAFEIIKEVRGFADFLAYQVFVDLTYIEDFPFSENEFVVAGPGCRRGLDLLFETYDGMTHEEALFYLRDNLKKHFDRLYAAGKIEEKWNPKKLFKDRDPYDRCLNVMSLENCFCELSKYIRASEGTGRPRNKYHQTFNGYHYEKEKNV